METEAKFIIRGSGQVDQVLNTLEKNGYALGESQTGLHTDTYFDTRGGAIRRAGWGFRFRQHSGYGVLTLKSFGRQKDAVFFRTEIEQSLPDQIFDADSNIPEGPVQQKLAELVGEKSLRELFSIRTRRTVFTVASPGDNPTTFELDLDQSVIQASKARKRAPGRLSFKELELEGENEEVINSVAQLLRSQVALIPSQFSKYDRGLYTAGITWGSSRGKTRKRLRGKDRALKLIYRHLRQQLAELQIYQPVAYEGIDPEGVHKMRVAIRRIQAVLRTFRKMISADIDKNLGRELRWLRKQLGKARDADVCEMAIRGEDAASLAAPADEDPYLQHLEQSKIDSYHHLAEVFDSQRYSDLIEKLDQLFTAGPGKKTRARFGKMRITTCADRHVHDCVAKMLKRGNRIKHDAEEKQLHELRLEAKRLRYILDFFSTAQPRKWRKPIAALEKLQDLLGDHQDAVMARERHHAYIDLVNSKGGDSTLLASIDQLIESDNQRIARGRRRFPLVWKRFRKSVKT